MPRRRTARGLAALSDEELDTWRREQGGNSKRVFVYVRFDCDVSHFTYLV